MSRHRRLLVLRGDRDATRAAARARLETDDVLWISRVDGAGPRQVAGMLGRTLDAVVVDLHDGLDADVLGMAAGMVRGGGALLLRLPPQGERPPPDARLAVHPHPPAAVGRRAWARLERWLEGAARGDGTVVPGNDPHGGSPEQDALVEVLCERWAGPGPTVSVLLAARGRGKSAALGRALAGLPAGRRVVLTAGDPRTAEAVVRFRGRSDFTPLGEALSPAAPAEVLVVDEAARLPVPTLKALVAAHPGAHLAFATTSEGYEGTGRGFVLRFLAWLHSQGAVHEHRLEAPIRWGAGCPLERDVSRLLALDAGPAPVPSARSRSADGRDRVRHRQLDRDVLARDEPLLRQVFGLLVHAHYRTTPGDLTRLLDGPNLRLHVLEAEGRVLAVNLVADEGALPPGLLADAATGRVRLRGQALADTLVTHAGRPEAGRLRMVRSVRIAVHPELRGRGLGRRLADAVHTAHQPDLFGTVFGATPEVLRFRRAQGYVLVRVGSARGDRTGEPAAVMVRPVSPEARSLALDLQAGLARNLPLQLAWMAAEAPLPASLRAALETGLPAPRTLSGVERDAELRGYLGGPRTSDSVAAALADRFAEPPGPGIGPADRALVAARFEARQDWAGVARAAGLPGVRAAQRRLKAVARVWGADPAPG